MFRRLLPLAALFAVGCVPVTEPVGDVTKAEPDKNLLGEWTDPKNDKDALKIELAPEVKGNPKGLMRIVSTEDKKKESVWFFVSAIGKQTYGNVCVDTERTKDLPDFSKEGEYARWSKGKGRAYFVIKYVAGKDELIINSGNEKVFKTIAEGAKLSLKDKIAYETPAEWLTKYIDKNGSDKIFPADIDAKITRAKKK